MADGHRRGNDEDDHEEAEEEKEAIVDAEAETKEDEGEESEGNEENVCSFSRDIINCLISLSRLDSRPDFTGFNQMWR
jgi:hypothetical protein